MMRFFFFGGLILWNIPSLCWSRRLEDFLEFHSGFVWEDRLISQGFFNRWIETWSHELLFWLSSMLCKKERSKQMLRSELVQKVTERYQEFVSAGCWIYLLDTGVSLSKKVPSEASETIASLLTFLTARGGKQAPNKNGVRILRKRSCGATGYSSRGVGNSWETLEGTPVKMATFDVYEYTQWMCIYSKIIQRSSCLTGYHLS